MDAKQARHPGPTPYNTASNTNPKACQIPPAPVRLPVCILLYFPSFTFAVQRYKANSCYICFQATNIKVMASNSFGTLFRVCTFGESHGPGIGVVIDGCPAGLQLDFAKIAD